MGQHLLSNYFVQFVNIIEKDIVVGHGFCVVCACACFSFDLFANNELVTLSYFIGRFKCFRLLFGFFSVFLSRVDVCACECE